MKNYISLLCIFFIYVPHLNAQNTDKQKADTLKIYDLDGIVVTANKIPTLLKNSTSAVSMVSDEVLKTMPRSIAADEALRLVPGVRIDNQANGSRLHMSIRGQGILSERGLRGIRVLIDGIPVNDPTGFAPDLYDVDWQTVSKIELIRGSSTALFGGSSSAGILNIITKTGGSKDVNGQAYSSFGSNGFYKVSGQINGSKNDIDYRVTASRLYGTGYRDHTGFYGNNISEKINWQPSEHFSLSQVFLMTDYFNQNAEGLSIDQLKENPKQANPDANPFNEYQLTNRYTAGVNGKYIFSDFSDIGFYGFNRWTRYKETSNKAAQYRSFVAPGSMIQYNMHFGNDELKNHISIGSEFQWQSINEVKFKSLSNPDRRDNMSQYNLEDTLMLANQIIKQRGVGVFLADQLEISKRWFVTGSLRYDNTYNKLTDKKNIVYDLSGSKSFSNVTTKLGLSYSFNESLNPYANWSQGFIPPATEELASNPDDFTGFNQHLKPATSMSTELGIRGSVQKKVYYDVAAFVMTTKKDFFRFKLYPARGNQEVFYGNTGNSKRYGLETYIFWKPIDELQTQIAYTYSHFKYTSPDSLKGNWLPNSPQHQFSADAEYTFLKNFAFGMSYEMQTKWYIYTDVEHRDLFQKGFNLVHARLTYKHSISGFNTEFGIYGKNLTNQNYVAFTEPDPDGNCYQPAARREFFGSIRVWF